MRQKKVVKKPLGNYLTAEGTKRENSVGVPEMEINFMIVHCNEIIQNHISQDSIS